MNGSNNENVPPFESYRSFFRFASGGKLPEISNDRNENILDRGEQGTIQRYRKRTLMEWNCINMGLLVKYVHTRISGDEEMSQCDDSFSPSDFLNEAEKLHIARMFGLMPHVEGGVSDSNDKGHGKDNDMVIDGGNEGKQNDSDRPESQALHQREENGMMEGFNGGGPDPMNEFDTQPTTPNTQISPMKQTSAPTTSSPDSSLIPRIKKLSNVANSVADLNLHTKTLNIPLASIYLYWGKCLGKRKAPKEGGPAVEFPSEWLKHGPLCQIFKDVRVVSFDLVGINCDHLLRNGGDAQDGERETSSMLRREGSRLAARSAFSIRRDGMCEKKRLKVYLYNHYATAFQNVMDIAQRDNISKGKDALRSRILISLRNIPAICILPHVNCYNPGGRAHLARDCDAEEKILEGGDYGSFADYCVCIGGKSRMKYSPDGSDDYQSIRMDSEDLELGILIKDESGGTNKEEYVLKRSNVFSASKSGTGAFKVSKEDKSDMGKLYSKIKATEKKHVQEEQHSTADDNHSNISSLLAHSTMLTSLTNKATKSTPRVEWMPLKDVRHFYMETKGKPKSKREFDIYAVVQDFRPPQLTKKGTYLMSIHVFDKTLPRLSEEGSEGDDQVATNLTINIFSRDKKHLPHIQNAGDVIHASRVVASEWNKAIQLDTWEPRNIAIFRPTDEALQAYDNWDNNTSTPLSPSASENDWVSSGAKKIAVSYERIHDLWKAARARISFYPHTDSRFKLTNADIVQGGSRHIQQHAHHQASTQHGDLTVMICNIARYKEDKRTNKDPRGILRCWDGTGVSQCDQLPEYYEMLGDQSTRDEPTEEAIVSLSKISEQMTSGKGNYRELVNGSKCAFKDIETSKCLCGRVVNIIVWESEHWALLHRESSRFGIGKFIRLKNARLDTDAGCFMINANTSMTPIPDSSFEVKQIVKKHQERLYQMHPFNPKSAYLPLHLPKRITNPSSFEPPWFAQIMASDQGSLLDCILETSSAIEKIKARFQIIGFSPNIDGESLLNIVSFQNDKYEFQFTLQIRDPYVNLVLIVPDRIAERMLGISASRVAQECANGETSEIHKNCCRRLLSLEGKSMDGTIAVVKSHESIFFILTDP